MVEFKIFEKKEDIKVLLRGKINDYKDYQTLKETLLGKTNSLKKVKILYYILRKIKIKKKMNYLFLMNYQKEYGTIRCFVILKKNY